MSPFTLPYAEDLGHYWQTSTAAPDSWVEKTKQLIQQDGGRVIADGFGSDGTIGRAAYMITCAFGEDRFCVVQPVLPSKTRNERAARRQAATLLYHEIKSRLLAAKTRGHRVAFFAYLVLGDGSTVADAAGASMPKLGALLALCTGAPPPAPGEPPAVDGQFREVE